MGGLYATVKTVLALALVGGAATLVVAPVFDMATARSVERAASAGKAPLAQHTPTPAPDATHDPDPTYPPQVDFEALLRACLETRDPDSEPCMNAQSESGLSPEDFRARIVAKLATPAPEPAKRPEGTSKPKPTTPPDFATYFDKCLGTADINSDPCHRAFELSGMSATDFENKFYSKLEAKNDGDFWAWFDRCLATRDRRSDVCRKAQSLIGFNDNDFQAKFYRYLAQKDGGDFWAWFDKCLATRDVRSEPCLKAQALIGFSDKDFQAKFARYLAERDATLSKPTATPKPTTTPKPTATPTPTTMWSAYTDMLVKDCLVKNALALNSGGSTAAITAAGEACQKAIIATGLSSRDFWARFAVPQPAKN